MDLNGIAQLIEEVKYLEKEDIEFDKKCSNIVLEIQDEKFTILELIEHLGVLLTNPSPSKRELGVIILTSALEKLPSAKLNSQQLTALATFYADRLKDHHQVIPSALKGITALAKFEHFPDGSATLLLNSIFHNIACQQQQQPDRYQIYTIFKILLEKHKSELCTMGLDFVYGVITAIDSERDPKNLLFIFQWIPTFLRSVSLGHLTEEMFEVLSCYFPVDFRAPPQDPNALTREDLSESLCPCLCAIPEFAEHCIPLAIDKLDSSLLIAKIDSLKLLKEGCKNFDVESFTQHSSEIWSIIQKELFNCKDPELEYNCLETLIAFINKLSTGDQTTFANILGDITDTVKGNLMPEAKLFDPSVKLLCHVALACQASAAFIVKEIVPILINTYNITETIPHKRILLKPLVGFLQAYSIFNHNIKDTKELCDIPLICLKATTEKDSELQIIGLQSLIEILRFVPQEVRSALYKNLIKFLTQKSPVQKTAIECLKKFAEVYQDEINSNIIATVQIENEDQLSEYLESLGEIVDQEFFTKIIIEKIISYTFDQNWIRPIGLEKVAKILRKHENNEIIQKLIMDCFFNRFIDSVLISYEKLKNNVLLLTCISDILRSIVGFYSSKEQKDLLSLCSVQISNVKGSCMDLYIILLDGFLTRLQIDVDYDPGIINDLINYSLTTSNIFTRGLAIRLLANLLNKYSSDTEMEKPLTEIKNKIQGSNLESIINIIPWITKALVMRNSRHADEWENLYLEYLESNEKFAKGFSVIFDDSYESLSRRSNCNIALLYKQKTFISLSNKLNEKYVQGKVAYLMAFGYLVEKVPTQVLLMQFVKLKKLIILCLEQCQDPDVLCVLLNSLKTFISNGEKLMEDHLEDFLSRFLQLLTFEYSMSVRVIAIQCLQEICGKYPVYKLLPYKQEVINRLAVSIDDKKRIVRKEAVQARSLWYLLDAPL